MTHRVSISNGSVLFTLFASIGMVGLIGAVGMNVVKGPVRTMAEVTKRTIAENHMLAAGKLSLIMAAQETGDCDADGMVEPLEWTDPAGKPAPLNGGHLPATIGAALQDPWGNAYGYCAWDHGPVRHHTGCGIHARRLEGADAADDLVIAIISSGPDRVFQTGCQPQGSGTYLLRAPGGDDVVLSYSFAEAVIMAGGLWSLKEGDTDTATIAKNLSVTDDSGTEQLSFDASSKDLSLGEGGTGNLPNIRTDYIQNLTDHAPVEFLTNIKMGNAWISGDGSDRGLKISSDGDVDMTGKVSAETAAISTEDENAVAAIVTASGTDGIGLKATGTFKAIESEGVLDMTDHKIVNLAAPADDTDAATKKYVDDKFKTKRTKCEAFVFSGCSGGTTMNLDKTTLGDCRQACESAGVRCCHAQFATTANDPETTLGKCVGHKNGGTSGALGNLVLGLLFPANVAAYCYEQY